MENLPYDGQTLDSRPRWDQDTRKPGPIETLEWCQRSRPSRVDSAFCARPQSDDEGRCDVATFELDANGHDGRSAGNTVH